MTGRIMWIVGVLAIIAAAAYAGRGLLDARAAESAARARIASLRTVAAQVEEMEELRAMIADRRTGVRPDAGMVGQLSTALGKAGISTARLAEVAPEPETILSGGTAASGAELRRQAVRLTLQPVSLPEIGRFVRVWRADQPEWTISGIEITRAGPAEVGIEPRLRCLLTLSAVYPAPGDAGGAMSSSGDVR